MTIKAKKHEKNWYCPKSKKQARKKAKQIFQ